MNRTTSLRIPSLPVALIAALLLASCAAFNPVSEATTTHAESLTQVQGSAVSGSGISVHARQVLGILDLEDAWREAPRTLPAILEEARPGLPDWQRMMARAELLYALAKAAEGPDRRRAQALYGEAVLTSLRSLQREIALQSVFDPRQRLLAEIYNRGLARFVVIGQELDGSPSGWTVVPGLDGERPLRIVESPGSWPRGHFDRFIPADELVFTGLRSHHREFGLGAPMIGVREMRGRTLRPHELPGRQVYPATAVLWQDDDGVIALGFANPFVQHHLTTQEGEFALSVDFSAALAHLIAGSRVHELKNANMFRPAKFEADRGIYLMEPYDPTKIPLVCIHGLWSTPWAWIEMMNEIYGDPELRRHYQIWQYIYPTGYPIALNAVGLRRELLELRGALDPDGDDPAMRNMVLFGHSMGGILARYMVTNSGDELWGALFDHPFTECRGDPEDLDLIRAGYFFEALPFVKRVVFFAVPFRGSPTAHGLSGALGRSLIKIPDRIQGIWGRFVAANPGMFAGDEDAKVNPSVANLRMDSPGLLALSRLPIADGIPYHSVLGDVSGKGPPDGTDGVVPYTSSHLEGAVSELVIPSDHGVPTHPLGILEARRILREHLVECGRVPPIDSEGPPK